MLHGLGYECWVCVYLFVLDSFNFFSKETGRLHDIDVYDVSYRAIYAYPVTPPTKHSGPRSYTLVRM